jgi:hypothetical protein
MVPAMVPIQTSVTRVCGLVRAEARPVQTIQAIMWKHVTILTTIAILLQSTVLERSGMELPVTGLIQTSARKERMAVQEVCRPVQTIQAAL